MSTPFKNKWDENAYADLLVSVIEVQGPLSQENKDAVEADMAKRGYSFTWNAIR